MTNNELLRLKADIFNWCHGFEYDHERLLKLAEQAIQEKIEIMFDGDVLPVLKDRASFCKRFTSETENVFRGIDITVV